MKNIDVQVDEERVLIILDISLGDKQSLRQELNTMEARMLLSSLEFSINQIEGK